MLPGVLLIFGGYLLGCVSSGYYVVRLCAGNDIRNLGSGSAGATNVGRTLGAWGFVATLLLDASKGMAVVWLARRGGSDAPHALWGLLGVVAGHIWPAQLGFRGGKGVAPLLGGILLFDYRIALAGLLLSAIVFLFTRRFTPSGLAAVVLSPIVACSLGDPMKELLPLSALAALVLIAHRENIRAIVWKPTGDKGVAIAPLIKRRTP